MMNCFEVKAEVRVSNIEFLKNFLLEHQAYFSFWLFKNANYYPVVCTIASDLLYGFLKSKVPRLRVVQGDYILNGEYNFHCWMECEGHVIDVTRFQFSKDLHTIPKWYDNEKDLWEFISRFYSTCVFLKSENPEYIIREIRNPKYVTNELERFKEYLGRFERERHFEKSYPFYYY